MKTVLSIIFFFITTLLMMQNKPKSYKLVWSEEFNEPELNENIWSFEEGFVRNNEKQFYTQNNSNNCRVEDGSLIIEARKEKNKNYKYSSASITTKNNKEFLYGRIEIRAKLPTGRGIWPAIWTLGTNIDKAGWPLCGEIDIMENVGYDPDKVHGNVHTKSFNHNLGTNKGNFVVVDSLSVKYHVYAIDWTREKIDFFLDDIKYFTFYNDKKGDVNTWPFDQPQYLLLNLAVGGFWGGKEGINDDIFPQYYKIDYVRYYEIEE
ncbi:glycoside hydrolase family 16 protein [Winogradskyella aquimaris]|uniref:Glycoside hydrolase family 16 protein n=1 Tax=Winogradskyella aquimaris TaxID=864074 RepID=A0ABU5EPJ4_9FLAO|nr:glycoside hydrolase family 16 protein [Winogradskyella aquimaris]MDY2587625.1 glycoside hydrolase family 16 protein [Winogradskyella aquimaris]